MEREPQHSSDQPGIKPAPQVVPVRRAHLICRTVFCGANLLPLDMGRVCLSIRRYTEDGFCNELAQEDLGHPGIHAGAGQFPPSGTGIKADAGLQGSSQMLLQPINEGAVISSCCDQVLQT